MAIERHLQTGTIQAWDEEEGVGSFKAQAFRPLTAEQATALRAKQPSLSPWRVVAVQGVVGLVAALLAGLEPQFGIVVMSTAIPHLKNTVSLNCCRPLR